MEILYRFFPETLIEATGWMLFHSLWQGAMLTIILVVVLHILKKYPAQVRYLLSFFTLVILMAWSGITFYRAYNYAREKQELKKTLISDPARVIEAMHGKIQQTAINKSTSPSQAQIRVVRFRGFMQRNFPIVFMLWLTGVFFFLFRMVGGFLYLRNLRGRQTLPLEDHWTRKIEKIKNRLGISRSIKALRSTVVKVPMVLGYIKPILLLPASFFTGLSGPELEAVITHELAHIMRHDYILNIIQSVIETLFFFHPAVWMISKTIRDEREHCCDDLAIEITGDRVAYVKALASSQELVKHEEYQYALTFSSGKSSLLKRIIRIKNHKIMKNKVPEGFIAASLIFISIILVSFTVDNRNLKNEYFYPSHLRRAEKSPTSISQPHNIARQEYQIDIAIDHDSLDLEMQEVMEGMEVMPEEMEQLMEIACTKNEQELALLILESVNLAMSQIDMEVIRQEIEQAMHEADSVMAELDVEKISRDAMEEARMEMEKERIINADEAVRIAAEALEAINIDEIVRLAVQETRVALQSIDLEAIQKQAMEEARAAIEEMERAEEMRTRATEEMERAEEMRTKTTEETERAREMREEATRENAQAQEEKNRLMEEQLEELEKE